MSNHGSRDRNALEQEAKRRQWPRLALLVGALAVAGALTVSFVGYRVSLTMLEGEYRSFYLERARSLAHLAAQNKEGTPVTILKEVEAAYAALSKRSPDEYMCIVDNAGRLISHTLHPQTVGNDAGDNLVLGGQGFPGCPLKALPSFKNEYVGGYVSSAKQEQIAAFVHIPELGWTLGVHRSRQALEYEVHTGLLPVFLGLLTVCGLLMPLSLVLLYRTLQKAQHQQVSAESKLRDSEERSRQILQTAMDGFWLVDGKMRLLEVNQAYCQMSGYSREELLTMSVGDLEALESPDDTALRLRRVIEVGQDRFISKHRRKDGSLFDVEVSIQHKPGQDGGRQVCFLRDITDHKLAEEELRRSGESYRTLVAGLPDIVMRFDREGRHLFVSQNVSRVVDLRAEDFIVKTHRQLGFPDYLCDMWEEAIQRVFHSGQPDELEFAMEGKKGPIIFNWRLIPERDDTGTVRSVLSISRDITATKRAEEELRLSLQTAADLVRAIPSGLFIYQYLPPDRLVLLSGNPEAERLTGISEDEFKGREFDEIWPQAREADITDKYLEVMRSGATFETEDLHYHDHRLDGAFRVRAFVLPGQRLAVAFENITNRKLAEEERAKLEIQLRQAQKMEALGTLAGGIAHDFNNILGAVLGFAEIAHEDAVSGRADPADIKQIMAAAQRARDLVKQILTFSRKNEPALQPLNLNQACKKAQEILRRTLPKMIAIECELDENLPRILADPTQVEQVLLNLASNAADAMAEGGRLTLATRVLPMDEDFYRLHPEVPAGDYVLLSVSDTGSGMDQETREHIFEPFFTTKGVGQGTGLGLSTAYGIVKTHGGFIYCQSEPNQGTTFNICLPVLAQEKPDNGPQTTEEDEAALAGDETILLADDEQPLRTVAARILRGVGYQVLEASSGEEALSAFADQPRPPDLVVMDLGMPGMGGHKAMLELFQRHPGTRVVIASGYAAHAQVRLSLEAGAAGYVAKPFKRAQLLAIVRATLDKERQQSR